jgi:hypothetical protein
MEKKINKKIGCYHYSLLERSGKRRILPYVQLVTCQYWYKL